MAASPTPSVAAAAAEATDGPVLSVVSKRLRALRKKHNRILQMEESLAAGKTLNREQEEVLRSKPVVVTLIDELERLRTPLASAVAEELASRPAPAPAAADSDSSIQDLLALIYFGSLFDVKQNSEFVATMVARTHERSCCITYDYVTDDAAGLLAETDLDKVSTLAALAASRPAAAAGVSHRDALQACAHHAHLWLRRAEEPIYPGSDITYAGVRAKLDRIMVSDYYTAQATMDVAAAVGGYAGDAQAKEGTVVSPEAPAVKEGVIVEGHKDDESLLNQSDEVPSTEIEQERFDADLEDPEQKDQQFIQHRSYQNQRSGGRGGVRRGGYPNGRGGRGGRGGGYQNGRGGYQNGRGGYQNGRVGGGGYQNGRVGGGGYQNGRGGGGGGYQNGRGGGGGYYYDSGYYQQRNYNSRGRGGGNSYYGNQGGGSQGGGHGHSGRVELGANA